MFVLWRKLKPLKLIKETAQFFFVCFLCYIVLSCDNSYFDYNIMFTDMKKFVWMFTEAL